MIRINYGTSAFFEEAYGDSSYCKSFTSAKKQLKRLAKIWVDRGEDDDIKEILKEYDKRVFNKKTCWNPGPANISIGDLHIFIEEINLI